MDDKFTRLTSLTRNTPNVQNLTVEQYVLVEYECALYSGQITEIKNDDEILINAMEKSGPHWKWPEKLDKIYYSREEIVSFIKPPKQINRRGMFKIDEL